MPENEGVWDLLLTPNEKLVATVDRIGQIFFRDFQTGKFIRVLAPKPADNQFAYREAKILISQDGSRTLSVIPSSDFCQTTLWDLQSGKQTAKIRIGPFDYSSEVRRLLPASESADIDGCFTPGTAAFSNDGAYLIGALIVDEKAVLRCWDAQSGNLLKTLEIQDRWGGVELAAHPTLPIVACGLDSQIRFYDIPGLVERRTGEWGEHRQVSGSDWIAFTKNGKFLVSVNSKGKDPCMSIVYPRGSQFQKPIQIDQMGGDWVRALALSRDGNTLIAGGLNGRLAVWNTRTGQLRKTWVGHQSHVRGISLAASDTLMVSGSDAGGPDVGLRETLPEIKIWRMDSGKLVRIINLEENSR